MNDKLDVLMQDMDRIKDRVLCNASADSEAEREILGETTLTMEDRKCTLRKMSLVCS